MPRKFLMVMLGLGAIAGFTSGFARLYHGHHGHFGHGKQFGRHVDLERRVADACTEAALRVHGRKAQHLEAGEAP